MSALTEALRVAVRTLGCKVNQVESEDIIAALLGVGIVLVKEDAAHLIVINTCTVTGEADRKARKAVRHALGLPGSPLVLVTGCLAAVDAPALAALGDRVIVETDKSRVPERVAAALGVSTPGPCASVVRAGDGFHTRAMLKVQDGCDNRCTYCIVPQARGVSRAVPLERLVEQAHTLVAAGAREIVVTGINVGRYRDAQTGADLATLLEALAASGIARLRLSSIEPPDLTDRLLSVMASLPSFCPHLHVPLQSGSDRVLAAMGRAYDSAAFLERIAAALARIPGLALTTDVIAGFPGETAPDLAATLDVCRRAGFTKMHVFRYSRRPGTPAAAMPDQLPPALIAAHAEEIRALGTRLRTTWLDTFVGRSIEVVVERVNDDGTAEGTTQLYAKVLIANDGAVALSTGAVVEVTIRDRVGEVLLGGV